MNFGDHQAIPAMGEKDKPSHGAQAYHPKIVRRLLIVQ